MLKTRKNKMTKKLKTRIIFKQKRIIFQKFTNQQP